MIQSAQRITFVLPLTRGAGMPVGWLRRLSSHERATLINHPYVSDLSMDGHNTYVRLTAHSQNERTSLEVGTHTSQLFHTAPMLSSMYRYFLPTYVCTKLHLRSIMPRFYTLVLPSPYAGEMPLEHNQTGVRVTLAYCTVVPQG